MATLKGQTIIEVLVAIVILTISFSAVTITYLRITEQQKASHIQSAQNEIQNIISDLKEKKKVYNEDLKYDAFTIVKKVSYPTAYKKLLDVSLYVKMKGTQQTILKRKLWIELE